jgi:hypothetical protein
MPLSLNEKIEFGRLLSAMLETASKYGHERSAIIASALAIEVWIDQVVEKRVNIELSKFIVRDAKTKLQ